MCVCVVWSKKRTGREREEEREKERNEKEKLARWAGLIFDSRQSDWPERDDPAQ
jgi:hypothetical protein